MQQPRILVIQDISASCRISANVAVPVLSCLNNAVNILPTALLSTHTGVGFSDYTYLDLTSEIKKILNHWQSLNLKFDGLLIGYLGSLEQIEIVRSIIRDFVKPNGTVVLDPVMGDHGFLYPGFDSQYVLSMRQLCQEVTVIIPNATEASLLLNRPYQPGPFSETYVRQLLAELVQLNNNAVVLTGVRLDPVNLGAASYSLPESHYSLSLDAWHPGHFDGTGDLFSSVVAGMLFQRKTLQEATKIAVTYVNRVISRTIDSHIDTKYGVQFETDLPFLMQFLNSDE